MVPDVALLCQLRVEVVCQRLQGRNVDLTIGYSSALAGFVEVVAKPPSPAGDCTKEALKAGVVAMLLLLLLSVGSRARRVPISSSGER